MSAGPFYSQLFPTALIIPAQNGREPRSLTLSDNQRNSLQTNRLRSSSSSSASSSNSSCLATFLHHTLDHPARGWFSEIYVTFGCTLDLERRGRHRRHPGTTKRRGNKRSVFLQKRRHFRGGIVGQNLPKCHLPGNQLADFRVSQDFYFTFLNQG